MPRILAWDPLSPAGRFAGPLKWFTDAAFRTVELRTTVIRTIDPVVVVCLMSCGVATDAGREESVPLLSALAFTDSAPEPGRALEIVALLAVGEQLADSAALRLDIATSGASQPSVYWAERRLCGDSLQPILCDRLTVKLKLGFRRSVLQPVLQRVQGQFVLTWILGGSEGGSVHIFGPALDEARAELEGDSHIERVSYVGVSRLAGGQQQSARVTVPTGSWLGGALKVTSGTRITATYHQPDGSVMQATAVAN